MDVKLVRRDIAVEKKRDTVENCINTERFQRQCTRCNGSFSVALHGNDEDLAGMNEIWMLDAVSVCPVHDRVSRAIAIGDAADAPLAVATGYDLGQILACDRSLSAVRIDPGPILSAHQVLLGTDLSVNRADQSRSQGEDAGCVRPE
jgi:hypothetical protein